MHGFVFDAKLARCLACRKFEVEEVQDTQIHAQLAQAVIGLAIPAFEPIVLEPVEAVTAAEKALVSPQNVGNQLFR